MKKRSLVCGVVVGWLLSACATVAATPDETVMKLAAQRWAAAVAGDFERVYSMTTPSYRTLVDYKRYRAKMGVASTLTGAEVLQATCEPTMCTVKTRLEAVPAIPGLRGKAISTTYDETWVLEDGEWWLQSN